MKKLTMLFVAILALAGCMSEAERAEYDKQASQRRAVIQLPSEKPPIFVDEKKPAPPPERFEVLRVQVITDYMAYNNARAIYILKDRETGREFVGLSGVGIAELGRVTCGKACSKEIER